MSVSGYSKIERGETKIAVSKLKKIAETLGVDMMELMSLGEKNVYFVNIGNSNGGNIISSPSELAFENQKLQLQLDMKDKELAMQQREIENLKEIIALLKRESV